MNCHWNELIGQQVNLSINAVNGNCSSCTIATTPRVNHSNHINTNNLCEDCHLTNAWGPRSPSWPCPQSTVPVASCHNKCCCSSKPSNHITSSEYCDDCHVSNWNQVNFESIVGVTSNVALPQWDYRHTKQQSTSNSNKSVLKIAILSNRVGAGRQSRSCSVNGTCSSCHNNVVA